MDGVTDLLIGAGVLPESARNWVIGENANIHPTARINVTERLVIGHDAIIGENTIIEGRDIEIGNSFYMLPGAIIGGGSCFERQSSLRIGHFAHLGRDSFINTARPVVIGDEVGLGTRTAIYTHGAYLSALDGFPVAFAPVNIGNRVWIPGATVNPGVMIGDNVVIGVGSVVTRSIPAGALAAGAPAKVIKEHAYPAALDHDAEVEFWQDFLADYADMGEDADAIRVRPGQITLQGTFFNPWVQTIMGPATEQTERLRDHLRRYGIRFRSRPVDGEYRQW